MPWPLYGAGDSTVFDRYRGDQRREVTESITSYFPALYSYLPWGLDCRRKDGWLGHIHESHHWRMVRTWLRYDSRVGMAGRVERESVCRLCGRDARRSIRRVTRAYCTAACTSTACRYRYPVGRHVPRTNVSRCTP